MYIISSPTNTNLSLLKGGHMNIQRAQEIINSRSLINVNYRGIPVFLQQVHEDNETATVFPLDEMDREQIVELDRLTDEGP